MRAYVPLLLALALLSLPPALGLPGSVAPQDDAGSGRDAGAWQGEAVHVETGVVYRGTLLAPVVSGAPYLWGDYDWYSFDVPAGALVEVRADGAAVCFALVDDAGTDHGFRCPSEWRREDARVQHLAPTAGRYHLWFRTTIVPVSQVYHFVVTLDATPPEPGAVDLAAFREDDAGSGRDAPDTAAGALPIEPGVAYEAAAGPPDQDWYAFEATEGQSIRVNALGLYACLALYDPDLVRAGSYCNVGYEVDEWGGDWVASSTGTWRIEASTVVPDAYAFAIALDTPTPPLQRPGPGVA